MSVGTALSANGGIGPGFDYIRIVLALLVLNAHTTAISSGRPADTLLITGGSQLTDTFQWSTWREPLYILIVPAFFALSGFLVTGSALRLRNTRNFLSFRALRIVPALSVEVALSAFVLGPLFTQTSLRDYFSSAEFFRYFGNIIGFVSYRLPSVFEQNPVSGIVNNSLWTLPPEFYCYLVLSGLMAISVLYRNKMAVALFIIAAVAMIVAEYHFGFGQQKKNLPVPVIVFYFFVGSFFYLVRDKIPNSALLMVLALGVGYCLSYLKHPIIASYFVSYFIVVAGVRGWPKLSILKKGDYSYGIYLYHFPIAQALIASFPVFKMHPYMFKLPVVVLTIFFSVMSWHWLEKPALKLKRFLIGRATPQAGSTVTVAATTTPR